MAMKVTPSLYLAKLFMSIKSTSHTSFNPLVITLLLAKQYKQYNLGCNILTVTRSSLNLWNDSTLGLDMSFINLSSVCTSSTLVLFLRFFIV